MRGGKCLDDPRMAELHARGGASAGMGGLETYGALFDRTADGRISQRNFGGHTYRGWHTWATARASTDDPDPAEKGVSCSRTTCASTATYDARSGS